MKLGGGYILVAAAIALVVIIVATRDSAPSETAPDLTNSAVPGDQGQSQAEQEVESLVGVNDSPSAPPESVQPGSSDSDHDQDQAAQADEENSSTQETETEPAESSGGGNLESDSLTLTPDAATVLRIGEYGKFSHQDKVNGQWQLAVYEGYEAAEDVFAAMQSAGHTPDDVLRIIVEEAGVAEAWAPVLSCVAFQESRYKDDASGDRFLKEGSHGWYQINEDAHPEASTLADRPVYATQWVTQWLIAGEIADGNSPIRDWSTQNGCKHLLPAAGTPLWQDGREPS